MGQITEDFARQMLRNCAYFQNPRLTVWEAEEFALAWLEREKLRIERDHARAKMENAIELLTGIHALLYPPPVKTADGKTMAFRPTSPDPHDILQELSDRIRALPDKLDEVGDAI